MMARSWDYIRFKARPLKRMSFVVKQSKYFTTNKLNLTQNIPGSTIKFTGKPSRIG